MTFPRPLLVAAACGALAACSHQPPPDRTPPSPPAPAAASTASPAARATPVPAPRASATPAPATPAPATPAPSAPPATAQAAAPRAKILAPQSAPEIIAIDIAQTTVHPGDVISGSVTTSSNVASVELRVGGYGVGMQKTGVGRFALSYPVPNVPFLHGTFNVEVIARNTAGASVERVIPLTVL